MSDDTTTSDFGTPFRALIDHCESNDLTFKADHEKKRIKLTICRNHALYGCTLQISHDDSIFQVYVSYPVLAKDEKMRPAATEFVIRANYGLVIGSFEMDMRDGEIRYHVGHLIGDGPLVDGTICHLFGTSLSTSDRYFPAFMRLLFGGNTAEDAVYLAELEMHSANVEAPPPASNPSPDGKADSAKKPAAPAKPAGKKKSAAGRKSGPPAAIQSVSPDAPAEKSLEQPADQPKSAGDNPTAAPGDQP
jgi:hypothetical protein